MLPPPPNNRLVPIHGILRGAVFYGVTGELSVYPRRPYEQEPARQMVNPKLAW